MFLDYWSLWGDLLLNGQLESLGALLVFWTNRCTYHACRYLDMQWLLCDIIIIIYQREIAYSNTRPGFYKRCHLSSIGNLIVEIRRSYDCLIPTMGFPILLRCHVYIEPGPRFPFPWLAILWNQHLFIKTSYRQIFWGFEATKLDVVLITWFRNFTGIMDRLRPRFLKFHSSWKSPNPNIETPDEYINDTRVWI